VEGTVGAVVRAMTMADYDEAIALWRSCEGIGLSASDEREPIARFLARNPGHSFVARDGEVLVGALLCGHEGRRGYLHHLSVAPSHRELGLGRELVRSALDALEGAGIPKCHLFVLSDNEEGLGFWRRVGWAERVELRVCSRALEGGG
jgi:ribosomal protein S18 acetylase RimI-like enzyme